MTGGVGNPRRGERETKRERGHNNSLAIAD